MLILKWKGVYSLNTMDKRKELQTEQKQTAVQKQKRI